MSKRVVIRWTEEEDRYVREFYGSASSSELAEVLSGRTPNAIKLRAKALGVQGTSPTPSDQTQKHLFPEGPWTCTKCEETKPVSEFYAAKDGGKQDYRCKECKKQDRRDRWAADPEGRERHKSKRLREKDAYSEHYRNYRLRVHYGLTSEAYNAILDSQGGVCAICLQPESKIGRGGSVQKLAVDHDHTCCPGAKTCGGCVRGLLCANCNQLLGKVENRGLLEGLQRYLGTYLP